MGKFFGPKLSLALMVLLSACSGGSQQADDERVRPLVIGFSQIGAETGWRIANTRSIQDAARDAGIPRCCSARRAGVEHTQRLLRGTDAAGAQ